MGDIIFLCAFFIGFRSHQRFLQVEKLRPNVLFHFMPCPPSVDVTCRSKTRGTNDNVNMERVLKITLQTFLPTAGYLIRVCTGHNLRSSGTRHLLGHVEASRFLRDFPDFGEGQEMCWPWSDEKQEWGHARGLLSCFLWGWDSWWLKSKKQKKIENNRRMSENSSPIRTDSWVPHLCVQTRSRLKLHIQPPPFPGARYSLSGR